MDTKIEDLLRSVNYRIKSMKLELLATVESLQKTLKHSAAKIANDQHVNSRGIVQQNGRDIDRLCAEYELAIEFRNHLEAVFASKNSA